MEIKRKINLSYDRVHKYLKDLEKSKILTSVVKGKTKLYKANLENMLTLKLFETFEIQKRERFYKKNPDIRALLERFTEDVLKQIKDKTLIMILFGSVAREKYNRESDVDILIITPNLSKSQLDSIKKIIEKTASEYSSIYERELVPLVIKLSEFTEGLKAKRDFYQEIWLDRIVLYGESRFFEEIAQGGVPVE
jgi:predicted nucleotidyltransferase